MTDVKSELPPLNTLIAECESTQGVARAWAERGAAHGSWVSARVQTRGRGRHERRWVSPAGNLFLSVIVRGIPTVLWTWIPLAAALAVRRAVLDLLPLEWESRITIKWPNDLLIDGDKAAGILCESSLGGGDERTFVIVGIGVNCAEAPSVPDRSTARFPIPSAALRGGVVVSLMDLMGQLASSGGAERIARAYEACSELRPGVRCRWSEDAGSQSEGTVIGLGPHGELRVRVDSNGTTVERLLSSEEVSLGSRHSN